MYRERNERLQIMLSREELRAIDDWRFNMRMPSRASAIRELIRLGMLSDPGAISDHVGKSSVYGVLDAKEEL